MPRALIIHQRSRQVRGDILTFSGVVRSSTKGTPPTPEGVGGRGVISLSDGGVTNVFG